MTVLAEHRKARFEYEILDTLEAGIVLDGQEVKSAKRGRFDLTGSHVTVSGGEAYLVGATIPPYQPKNAPEEYDPQRTRKLLLHQRELAHLAGKRKEQGLTIVPLRVYTRKGTIKLEVALARGKRKYDKREAIKKREAEREMQTRLKRT